MLVTTIYSEEEKALELNDDIQGLARDACEECVHILGEPEKSQARPAIKILCAFMATTRKYPRTIMRCLSSCVCFLMTSICFPIRVVPGCPASSETLYEPR